ncbi:helix-turn-helix domain-containing protein [Lysinibacillus fusiformis]|uniref:helix-turn-helix domain-containing protein n=1 Tax=Lysinibacillus fusiformis TaxID=28031 RepID=UPI0018E5AE8A|nr:helix-turn-helix domain-containing protein [Lysinibacillus fusiformis]MBI6865303.1 helix-turn-helix domain-containing protein [Lysinibacillus fusiformis]
MSYLTSTEAAKALEISYKSLLQLIKKGKLDGSIKIHGSWQIPVESVEQYKVTSSSLFIPKGYLTVSQIASQLNLTVGWVTNLIRKGTFINAKKYENIWVVPSSSIEEYVQSCDYSPEGFFSIQEAAEYLSVGVSWVSKLISKNVLADVSIINGVRYIKKDTVEEYLKSVSLPKGYMSIAQAAKELSMSTNGIFSLKNKGTFPGVKKQKIAYHHAGWIIPIDEIMKYKESQHTVKDIAAQLGISQNWVRQLIRQGIIHKTKKKSRKYTVSIDELRKYIEMEQKKQELEKKLTPVELFEYKLAELEIPNSFKKTVELYREFVALKINSSQGNEKTIHNHVLRYIKTFKRLCSLLVNEVFFLNVEQLESVFKNPDFTIHDTQIFIYFLEFCSGKGVCTFSKRYAVTSIKPDEQEIYSPKQFLDYYTYTKDINLHIQRAIQSRDYAITWLFVLMHVIDAWRPSDIIKLPNVALEVANIQTFDQILETELPLEQAQAIINHLYSSVERMFISKTGALGHFLVNQDMVVPTATVLIIAELHRRNEKDHRLFKVGKRKFVIFDKRTHFQSFFDKQPQLIDFQSRKMNRTLLTYFFYSIVGGKGSSDIAYEFSQQLRGHTNKNSTSTYIQSVNNDGPINQVSLNLFNRGHFGWLYHHIIHLSIPEASQLDLNIKTSYIEQLKSEYSPYQLEQLSHFLIHQQNSKESLALKLSSLSNRDLITLLLKIYKDEMPAKLQHVQCLNYPSCSYPTSTTCLHCEYAIPKIYVLISIQHEINRLVESIQKTEFPAIRVRDSKLLFQILDLLSQAVQQFGKPYVQTFINLTNVKQKMITIKNLISEEI